MTLGLELVLGMRRNGRQVRRQETWRLCLGWVCVGNSIDRRPSAGRKSVWMARYRRPGSGFKVLHTAGQAQGRNNGRGVTARQVRQTSERQLQLGFHGARWEEGVGGQLCHSGDARLVGGGGGRQARERKQGVPRWVTKAVGALFLFGVLFAPKWQEAIDVVVRESRVGTRDRVSFR